MSSNLMDTEPGGRNTPYESIKTVTNPTAKEPGQLGAGYTTATSTAGAPGSATNISATHVDAAEKIRFGQAISEKGGVSGQTGPGFEGKVDAEGKEAGEEGEDAELRERRKMGYGEGSGVGA